MSFIIVCAVIYLKNNVLLIRLLLVYYFHLIPLPISLSFILSKYETFFYALQVLPRVTFFLYWMIQSIKILTNILSMSALGYSAIRLAHFLQCAIHVYLF